MVTYKLQDNFEYFKGILSQILFFEKTILDPNIFAKFYIPKCGCLKY